MPSTTAAPLKSWRNVSYREIGQVEGAENGPPVNVFGQTTRGPITLKAGPAVVIEAPGADPVRVPEGDTDPLTVNVAGYKKIRFQVVVLASSVPEGCRAAFRGIRFKGADWQYLNDAEDAPWVPVHAVNESNGRTIPVMGDWFVIDPALDIDNLTLEWVLYGGDGTGEVTLGNIYVDLTSDPRPPTSVTPTPEVPTSGLVGYWKHDEGLGTIVENDVSPGTGDLVFYPDDAPTRYPGWSSSPKGLTFGSAGFLLRKGASASLPVANGTTDWKTCGLLFYFKLPSTLANTVVYEMCFLHFIGGSTTAELRVKIVGQADGTGLIRIERAYDSSNAVIFTGTVPIVSGGEYAIGVRSTTGTLELYINNTLDTSNALPGVTAPAGTPQFDWGAFGNGFSFASGTPGLHGECYLWNGDPGATAISDSYAVLKANGYDLP